MARSVRGSWNREFGPMTGWELLHFVQTEPAHAKWGNWGGMDWARAETLIAVRVVHKLGHHPSDVQISIF
jgi:hypothetical protein